MSRPYGGRLPETRSADRRARLVQAAIELVGNGGVSEMSMRAVCREAGLSQKFFYESFTGTDELLHVVYRTTLDTACRTIESSAPAGGDDPSTIWARVDSAARLMREDPRICRILLIEPVADLRLRQFVRDILAATLGRSAAAASVETPRLKMQYATVFGAMISLFIEWTEGNLGEDRHAFVDHVTNMLLASPLVRASAMPSQIAVDHGDTDGSQ